MAMDTVIASLKDLGDIKAIQSPRSTQGGVKEIRLEYYDVRAADRALNNLHDKHIGVSPIYLTRVNY